MNYPGVHPNITDRDKSIRWARRLLERNDWCILDTETTGLLDDPLAEIIQIGILAPDGAVLLDTLVKPLHPIPEAATAIHGITDRDVVSAPSLTWVIPAIEGALRTRSSLVIYNVVYDRGLIGRALSRVFEDGAQIANWIGSLNWSCAMKKYAQFIGQIGRYGDYRWQKLPPLEGQEAHSAITDCRATLALIRSMAEARLSTEADIHKAFREAQERIPGSATTGRGDDYDPFIQMALSEE